MNTFVLRDSRDRSEVYAVIIFHEDVDLSEVETVLYHHTVMFRGDSLEEILRFITEEFNPIKVFTENYICEI